MSKTLFAVKLPQTGKTYDFWVPDGMQMQEATNLVSKALQVAEPDFYEPSPDAALLHVPTGRILSLGATVAELQLSDGSAFVMV